MIAVILLLAVLSAAVPGYANAAEETPEAELAEAAKSPPKKDDGSLPKAIEAFFEKKGGDGKPVLGDAERAMLKKFPVHTREKIGQAAEDEMLKSPEHLKVLLSLELSTQTADIVFTNNCVLCHSDPGHAKKTRFSLDPKARLNLASMFSDAHFRRGLMCEGCHGGNPTERKMNDEEVGKGWPDKSDRPYWIPEFCAHCHADPAFMRNFNPSLPTDQYAKYKESRHGELLLKQHDRKAAQCVSCHGLHGIRGPKIRTSTIFPQAIPETCGHCHADAEYMAGYKADDGSPLPTNQLEQYKKSVHGVALLEKGDLSSPACNDCHGNHAAKPPATSSVSQVCRTCHVTNGTLFDGSKHKVAFEKHGWPECAKCHGKHDIEKPTIALISASEMGLCGSCHDEYSRDNPQCNKTARYFHDTLTELVKAQKALPAVEEDLAERGLDTDPILASASELDEAVMMARTRVHSFDKGNFDTAANAGREAIKKTEKLIADARAEQKFRLKGLLASIGVMGLLAVALGLKIRELDRQRAVERSSDSARPGGKDDHPTA
jgi:predicted CXXCH cytochrome family protein